MNKTLKLIICIILCICIVGATVLVINKFFHQENTNEVIKEDDGKDILEIDEEGITIVDDSEENVSESKDSASGRQEHSSNINKNNNSSDNTSSNNTSDNNTSMPTHDHIAVVLKKVAPTCEEDGLTEGKQCSICGAILEAQNVIPKLGHSYNKDGKCIRCGANKPDESNEIELPKVKIK